MDGERLPSAGIGAEYFSRAPRWRKEKYRALMPFKTSHKAPCQRGLSRTGISVEDECTILIGRCLAETCQSTDYGNLLVVGGIRKVAENLGGEGIGVQNLVLQIISYVCYDADCLDIWRITVAVAD